MGVTEDRIRSSSGKVLLNHEFQIGMKIGVLNENLHSSSLQLTVLNKFVDESVYFLKFKNGDEITRMRSQIRLKESIIEQNSESEFELESDSDSESDHNPNESAHIGSTPFEPVSKRLRTREIKKVSYCSSKNESFVETSKTESRKKKKQHISIGLNEPNIETEMNFPIDAVSISEKQIQNERDNTET